MGAGGHGRRSGGVGVSGQLTIVVGVPDPPAIELHDVLKTWARDDLVDRFVWLDAGQLPSPDWRPGDAIDAEVLSTVGSQRTSLLDEVAGASYATVRLVLVQLLPGRGTAGVPPSVATLESILARAVAPSQRLVKLNLLVPATATADLPADLLLPLWDVNVVAAPEDRISDRHADAHVRHPGNFAAHAALECATVAGLWSQVEAGAFDERRVVQSDERCKVVVVRSFGRIIRGAGLVDEVLERVFAIRGGGSPVLAQSAGGAPARDPEQLVARTAEQFVAQADGGGLNLRPARPGRDRPTQVTVGLLQAVSMLFRFLFSRLRSLPGETIDQVRSGVEGRLERLVQGTTFGEDSMVAARFGNRPAGEADLAPEADEAQSARRHAEEVLARLESPASPPASPGLWQELRGVCFGLVDGGDMPACVAPPMDGSTRQVLVDGSPVAARPDPQPFRLADILPLRYANRPGALQALRECDPYQADQARHWLAALVTEARQGGERDADAVLELERAAAQFEAWAERRGGTLVWRTADHLGQQLGAARRALADAVAVLRAGSATLDQAGRQRAGRRLKLWWLLLALFALLSLWGAAWWDRSGADTDQWATVAGLALLVWLGGSLWVFIRFQRQVFQLLYRYNRALWAYRNALQAAVHHGHEVVRLASLYEQLRDWAEIVAWMIHRPEGPAGRGGERSEPFEDAVHPRALRLATGRATAGSLTRVSAMAARSMFAQGWLSALYARYAEDVMAELRLARGLDEHAPGFDPDADVADPKRAPLLTAIREGRPAEGWRREARAEVTGQLAATDPRELFPLVAAVGRDADDLPVDSFLGDLLPSASDPWRQSLTTSLWSPVALVNRFQAIQEAVVWLPAGLPAPAAPEVVRHPTRGHSTASDSYTIQALRLDLTAPCPFDQLAIFRPAQPDPPQPVPSAADQIG